MKRKQEAAYGVIGLGRFGTALATSLANAGKEVIVVDKDENKVKEMRQYRQSQSGDIKGNRSAELRCRCGLHRRKGRCEHPDHHVRD